MQHTLQTGSVARIAGQRAASASAAPRRVAGRRFTAIAVGQIKEDELPSFAASPERPLSDPSASVVKRGRSALVVRVDLPIGGGRMRAAYKQCGGRSWLRRIARGIRTSAAVRNFRLGHRLLNLGIDTPQPLIAVAPRWRNFLRPSYLATEWIEDALPLDAFGRATKILPPARRRAELCDTARSLGRLIGTLHRQGFSHRDLKSANLLVRERDWRVEVFLVDLDGAARARFRVKATRLKNLARLQAATGRMTGVTATLRCRFLRTYLATLGNPAEWKTVWRQLAKASRIPPAPAVSFVSSPGRRAA